MSVSDSICKSILLLLLIIIIIIIIICVFISVYQCLCCLLRLDVSVYQCYQCYLCYLLLHFRPFRPFRDTRRAPTSRCPRVERDPGRLRCLIIVVQRTRAAAAGPLSPRPSLAYLALASLMPGTMRYNTL
jgi:hypothetical protein